MNNNQTDHGGLLERAYQYISTHRRVGLLAFLGLTLLLLVSVLRLGYKEDISDFLPLDSRSHEAMRVYQDISGADRLFVVFQQRDTTTADPDEVVAAIDAFASAVEQRDTAGMVVDLTTQMDFGQTAQLLDFVYQNIPYFLTADDYARMEARLCSTDNIRKQLVADKQLLLFPGSSLLADNIGRDPLNLFTPVVDKLRQRAGGLAYELYDGHIFSPDMTRGIALLRSPYGSSETEHNAQLLNLLDTCCAVAVADLPNIEAHVVGGPAIAVGNAMQIRSDSILSVAIAVVLILALLFYSLRNCRNLLLIAVSIGWGWLFALGSLAVVHSDVSIIVIGISSVILGIAVNYPLHLIAHLSHTPDLRATLRELAAPLVVGNVTTVGAFLALVPLRSVALRDLGLFAAFLLVGTILFVLFCLPHLVKVGARPHHTIINRVGELSLDGHRWIVVAVVALTAVFGWFSQRTGFDTNLSHINYMTDQQRADMDYFARLMADTTGTARVYALSTATTIEAALDSNRRAQAAYIQLKRQGLVTNLQTAHPFLVTQGEQRERIGRWQAFVQKHRETLTTAFQQAARAEGFAPDAFADFSDIISRDYVPQPQTYFEPLTQTALSGSISCDTVRGLCSVVDVLTVRQGDVERVEDMLQQNGCYAFDIQGMNSAIANHLSDDFNYIGWACGCIVFLFLWLSFGSLELAILSFIPMAVSWVWILGIMGILGLQFNIVNVILATFIFGQGDDYTIFMTEGACYEYAYRRRMLASYKHSIILSALIMFIGIGTLILARHPALRSLAELTIAGMFSVVLMAYVFPPLIFRWLVQRGGQYRVRPLSFRLLYEQTIGRQAVEAARQSWQCGKQTTEVERYLRRLVFDRYRYRGADICRAVSRGLKVPQPSPEMVEGKAIFRHGGYGEQALLYALLHPHVVVEVMEEDNDMATVAKHAAEGIVKNLIITSK